MSEVMTDKGVSLGTMVNWICTIIVALIVPTLINIMGGYLFIAFGVICGLCGFFVMFFMKETKGLTN